MQDIPTTRPLELSNLSDKQRKIRDSFRGSKSQIKILEELRQGKQPKEGRSLKSLIDKGIVCRNEDGEILENAFWAEFDLLMDTKARQQLVMLYDNAPKRKNPERTRPHQDDPFIVSCGVGVDSVAILVGLAKLYKETGNRKFRPDAIQFADTQAEKPITYQYIPILNKWLRRQGFPSLTVVTQVFPKSTYTSPYEKMIHNETMPSPALGGGHSCSLSWKVEPMNRWCSGYKEKHAKARLTDEQREAKGASGTCMQGWEGGWTPAYRCWERGGKVLKAIGYNADEAHRNWSKTDDESYRYWYPLLEWQWDRERCEKEIGNAGLPVPQKSACFFCPANKPEEVRLLARDYPELFEQALLMERTARDGKHGFDTTLGLGRTFSWEEVAYDGGPVAESFGSSCEKEFTGIGVQAGLFSFVV